MVLWGGLRPIASRVFLDLCTLTGWTFATVVPLHDDGDNNKKASRFNGWILLGASLLALTTAGTTNRWTLTGPMVPLLVLQALRRVPALSKLRWVCWTIAALSLICVLSAALLSILFPAVELPPIDGPYNVGLVDFFLPVEETFTSALGSSARNEGSCVASCSHVSVRLLYPTLDPPETLPYLNPATAVEYCKQSMRFGAPPPLKEMGWMLHTWRLTVLRAKRNATLLHGTGKLPLVVFSHGLGGNADIYSYQTNALAAHGNVVLVLNHLDGSGPAVQTVNGTIVTFDYDIGKLWLDGKHEEYARARRNAADWRVQELLCATEAVRRIDSGSHLTGLDHLDAALRGRILTDDGAISFMGHSFGGVTALTAAKRRPDLSRTVIAHEPSLDWMPDDARRSFFAKSKIEGLENSHLFEGGTGGLGKHHNDEDDSMHDINMMVLFSHEWNENKWAWIPLVTEMFERDRLGPKEGIVNVGVIEDAHHNEFSDTCILTPIWLARSVGITGKRSPLDTAKEIHQRTLAYLEAVRSN